MIDQNTFMETLNSVKEIIRVAETPMSEQEILAYFADMELEESQKQLISAYLSDPKNYEEQQEKADDKTPQEPESIEMEEETNDSGDGLPQPDAEEDLEHSKVFKMYLEELALLPKYSEEEETALYKRLLQGDSQTMDIILTAWLEKVLNIAKKYLEPGLKVEDIVQEGNMALFLKLQELCGSMAKVDVEEELLQAVEEGIMTYASEVRDEREMEDTLVGKVSLVHAAKKLLMEERGFEPTIEELSEYTKMSVKELNDLEDMMKDTDSK